MKRFLTGLIFLTGVFASNPTIHCVALLGDVSALYDAHAL
jgi:hypothetical protein